MSPLAMLQSGQSSDVPTILGNRPLRFPVGGKVRPGIMVLTKDAAQHKRIQAIYDRGVAAGESFEAIEQQIREAVPDFTTKPLVPRNVPWFTVRRSDFSMPEIADLVMAKYAEDRGDGVRRLYRFRVVFPLDSWQALMPHTYQCFGTSGLKYWSEFAEDGLRLRCMSLEPVPVNVTTKRAVKLAGGRNRIPRKDNDGWCNPGLCPEYQRGECKLRGRLYFFIPGIPTIDVMELPTSSIFGLEDVRAHLAMMAAVRGGRIAGFLDDREATFWITKKLKDLPGIDEFSGRPVRRKQWVVVLEADTDVTQLLRADRRAATVRGERAVAVLNGEAVLVNETSEAAQLDSQAGGEAPIDAPTQVSVAPVEGREDQTPVAVSGKPVAQDIAATKHEIDHPDGSPLDQLLTLLRALNVDAQAFEQHAAKRWGSGWKLNPNGIRRALAEAQACRDHPEQLTDRIHQTFTGQR